MIRDDDICIVAMGANTPIGHDAWSTAAAVRAGISGFSEHPHMIDKAGVPMRIARVDALDIGLVGAPRLQALLSPALTPVIEPLTRMSRMDCRTAIVMALPPQRPGLPDDLPKRMVDHVQRSHAGYVSSAAAFATGHTAGLMGLQAAHAQLREGTFDAYVLAGVDSYMGADTLEWLEDCEQLHGAGRLNNAWGFIPGEAAAAMLLVRASTARELGLAPLGVVLGCGVAFESKRIKTETVCIGEGLTAAFRQTLSALPPDTLVSDVYCDMNGEPYRADEYGFAALRTKDHFICASDFVAPADCVGDVAAAGSVLHMQLACIAGQKRYGQGPLSFVWASSEGGERAAALLATPQQGR